MVLAKLKLNSKIARATHNIYAYRVLKTFADGRVVEYKDCDCDGETGAGPKLLRLLHLMRETGIIVIVTRWYGGIHLGPDRFRHITNAARDVIISHRKMAATWFYTWCWQACGIFDEQVDYQRDFVRNECFGFIYAKNC